MSESELISSYSTRGFTVLTPGGAVSPRVKYSGPGAAKDSRLCLLDLCRLRFEEEDDIEGFNCTLPSLLGLSPAEVRLGAWVWWWCAPLLLDSGFLLVPWCRSDPGIPHAGVGTSPATGPRRSRQCIHGKTVATSSAKKKVLLSRHTGGRENTQNKHSKAAHVQSSSAPIHSAEMSGTARQGRVGFFFQVL